MNPCRFALAFIHSLSGEPYRNLLDIPHRAFVDLALDDQTYDDDEPFLMPRDAAFRLAAHYNDEAAPAGVEGFWIWHIVVELKNRTKWTQVTLDENGEGTLNAHDIPIRIVKPTAEERRTIGSRKAVRT